MKEQEVLWFDMANFTSDDLNESIALLNAQGKRVVNISITERHVGPSMTYLTACLLCEKA